VDAISQWHATLALCLQCRSTSIGVAMVFETISRSHSYHHYRYGRYAVALLPDLHWHQDNIFERFEYSATVSVVCRAILGRTIPGSSVPPQSTKIITLSGGSLAQGTFGYSVLSDAAKSGISMERIERHFPSSLCHFLGMRLREIAVYSKLVYIS